MPREEIDTLLDLCLHDGPTEEQLARLCATARAAHEKDAEIAQLKAQVQRLWDLCRYQRGELFQAELINEDEFFAFAIDHAAVARLETYDGLRAEVERLKADGERLDWLEKQKYGCWGINAPEDKWKKAVETGGESYGGKTLRACLDAARKELGRRP